MADDLGKIPMSQSLQATLIRARDYAAGQAHAEVTLEHLLLALTEDDDAVGVMQSSRIDLARLRNDIASFLGDLSSRMSSGAPGAPAISPQLTEVLRYATLAAKQGRRGRIDGAIVLAALVGDGRSMAASFLKAQGLTFEEAIRALQRTAAQPAAVAPPPQRARLEPPTTPPGPDLNPGTPISAPGPAQAEDILAAARERVSSRTGLTRLDPPAGGFAPSAAAMPHSSTSAIRPQHTALRPADADAFPIETAPHERAEVPPIDGPAAREPQRDAPTITASEADAPGTPGRPLPGTVAAAAAAAAAVAPGGADLMAAEPPSPASLESTLARGTAEASDALAQPPIPTSNWSPPPLPAPRPAQSSPASTPAPGPPRPSSVTSPVPDHTPGQPSGGPLGSPSPRPFAADALPPGQRGDTRYEPLPSSHQPHDIGQRAPAPQRPYANGASGYGQPPASPQAAPPRGAPPAPSVPSPPPGNYSYQSAGHRGRPADALRPPAIDAAQITHTIPARLQVGQRTQVEVRVGRNSIAGLTQGPNPTATLPDFAAARAISVRLRAQKPGLIVEAVSPETQWDQAAGQTGRLAGDAAVWRFTITAQATGARDLQLLVAARTVGADGVIADMIVPEQTIPVAVPRNWLATLSGIAGKLGLIVGTVLVLELARAFLKLDLGRLVRSLFGF